MDCNTMIRIITRLRITALVTIITMILSMQQAQDSHPGYNNRDDYDTYLVPPKMNLLPPGAMMIVMPVITVTIDVRSVSSLTHARATKMLLVVIMVSIWITGKTKVIPVIIAETGARLLLPVV